ncbi:hypothetical protein LIER_06842 [Lithospermum erythrorhizon]|uniref:Uncharacterized protein n=1 Tax=Lithospermum erythrorhizon TaxID=34254 RepID=A0AAV3P5V1_LITER
MPGNNSGDRVHNFFPQDTFLQGPHHQHTEEATWSVANNNFWAGGQTGLPNTTTKNVNNQHSVTYRGQGSHALHGQSGLNSTRTSSKFSQNLFQRQQLNSNGYTFGDHGNQTKQDGANILSIDTIPDQHNLDSRGPSAYESHQGLGLQHQTKSLVGSELSESPETFSLFENQQQMLRPPSSMLQSFQKQQSGFTDMQQLQQQIICRKMQELQRQQQLCQPDGRQQDAGNPISPFSKQFAGSLPSAMVNIPSRTDSQNSLKGTESGNANWLQRASSVVQGSPNGFVSSASHVQARGLSNLGAVQDDQSLYGDTHPGSRGNLTQFPEITLKNPFTPQVAAFSNNVPMNQYQPCIEQTSVQEESMISRLGFPGENLSSHSHGLTFQQVNPVKKTASSQEIHHEVARLPEKTLSEDVTSQNEVPLDPSEARILYGSENNIWAAFGESLDDCGDAGGSFDNFQSGTWSALMQSAVAETSSNDVRKQEEVGGLNLQNTSTHSENLTSTHRGMQEAYFHKDMQSPLNLSELNPDISSMNNNHQHISGVQLLENKLSCEPGQMQGSASQRYGSNISSPGALQNLFTDVRPTHLTMSLSGGPEANLGHYRGPSPPDQSGLRNQYGNFGVNSPLESVSRFGDATMHERENPLMHSQGYEQKAGIEGEVGPGGFRSNSCPMPSISAEVEHAKSSQAMFWRNVNPAIMSYGSGCVDRSHHYVSQENQAVDSSLNSHGKANANPSEMENCKRNDSSNNSYYSDLSRNNSSFGVRENMMSDVGDSHSMLPREQKYFNHNRIGKTSMDPLKFQLHPMGNVDEDKLVHLGVNHSSNSQDKDTTSSSQNMLDLHKIDQSRGHGLLMYPRPSGGHNVSSELPETDNCGTSASLLQTNCTSTSQGFGLQLGPPSHSSAPPSQSSMSQGSLQKGKKSHQSQDASGVGERGRSQLPFSPVVQSLPPLSGRTVREFNHNRSIPPERVNDAFTHKMPGISAKDVPVSEAMNGNAQQGTSFEVLPNMWSNIPGQPHQFSTQIRRTSSNGLQFHQPNVLESNSFTPHKHSEQEYIAGRSSPSASGSSSMNKGSPGQQESTGISNRAQRDELQRLEPASNNFSYDSPSNSVSMPNGLQAFGRSLIPSNSSRQNYSLLHQMGIVKSADTDPNESPRKRLKSPVNVEESRELISEAAKSSDNAGVQHASVSSENSRILNFSGLKDYAGSKAHAQLGNRISQNTPASSQEDSRFNHDGNNPSSVKVDQLYISPQMRPSWFNQYGGFRNGQMLTGHDARRGTISKTAEPPFSHGKTSSGVHMSNSNVQVAAAVIGPGEIDKNQQSPFPISAAVEPQSVVLNVTKSKKRERETFRLSSWRKQVLQRSRNPRTISMTELNWAKAANRLMEKIEDEVKFSEGVLPMLKAKRRVTLATQLMQQLLSPPKSALLSSEAELNYDGVAYSVSRLALGEACSLLPCPNRDPDKFHPVMSLLCSFSGKDNELEKVNDRHLPKLVEGFMGRTQKLESDFLRLDKRASLIDVRSECQELEKFSVINRFAKFHGRGQAETGDTSSSNGAANALRPYPQRYVTALPVPRSLPDRVHCLSL